MKQAASLSIPELKKAEGRLVLDMLQPADYLLALDEHGKSMSTLQLSGIPATAGKCAGHAEQRSLLIGGAFETG